MKKFYQRNIRKTLIVTIFLLTLSIIVYSCRKEVKETNNEQQPQQSLIKVDIAALKDIYNKTIGGSSSGIKTLSGNSTLNFIRTLNVNWDTYTLQKRIDSSIVAEFDMKNDTGFFALKKFYSGDTIKYTNKTTVTFIKFKDGSRLNFFTKIIEDLTLPGSVSVINKLHYNQIPYGFTGMILYYNLDRQYINGYSYKNGVIQGTVSLTTTPPATSDKSVNSIKTSEAMACVVTPVYQMFCQTVSYAGYTFDSGCTDSVVGYSVSCSGGGSNGGGSGSVGGDTGGGTSSSNPATPCTPTTPSSPVAEESVSNGKHTLVVQPAPTPVGGGGSGGGETGTGGNTPCASNNQIVTVDPSITTNDKLSCIYSYIAGNSIYNSLTGAFASGNKYNLRVTAGTVSNTNDLGVTSHTLNNPNVTITINSNQVDNQYSLLIAGTFIHEAFHAFIDQLLIQRNISNGNDFNGPFAQSFDRYILSQVDNTRATYQQSGTPFDQNTVQHQVISENINILARGLQEYVKSAFPSVYNDPSITFDNYVAYAWKSTGLQSSNAFSTTFDTQAKIDDLNSKRNALESSTTIGCKK